MYKKTGWGFTITALILAGAIYSIDQIEPQLGIDLQGGVELTYELKDVQRTYTGRTLAETVKRIISNRLLRYGVKEISIATQGEDAEPPVASRAEAETGAGVVAGPTGAGAGATPTAAPSEQ